MLLSRISLSMALSTAEEAAWSGTMAVLTVVTADFTSFSWARRDSISSFRARISASETDWSGREGGARLWAKDWEWLAEEWREEDKRATL
jgi:hypothetical protein